MTHPMSVIAGVVKDKNGSVISGARVSFVAGPIPLQDIAALTDVNGSFVLSAPRPGEYTIEVLSEGFSAKKAKIATEGNQEKHIEIILSRQGS
jgi:Carboxypeptidase regulatory-like domain